MRLAKTSTVAVALLLGCSANGAAPRDGGMGLGALDGAAVGIADAGGAGGEGGADDVDSGSAAHHDAADASTHDAALDAAAGTMRVFIAGVDVHNYPKPTAYGYTVVDGADRMGNALRALGALHVRGATIGDTTFLARLASFGVKSVVLGLDAKAYGKPFDAVQLASALDKSIAAAASARVELQVEGLNEWDLFNSKTYNEGVIPAGKSVSDFVLITQRALYEAAHAKGIKVLGPSVGHPDKQPSLDLFPDVSGYVDIVNMHLYYGTSPETLPVADHVRNHQKFQGAGKPVWITETGVSAYGGVTAAEQGDIISRGLATFVQSRLIDAAFNYELIDSQLPGLSSGTYVPESGEYHFGLFAYDGKPKPAAAVVHDFIVSH